MGGKDLDDIVDAARYVLRRVPGVPDRDTLPKTLRFGHACRNKHGSRKIGLPAMASRAETQHGFLHRQVPTVNSEWVPSRQGALKEPGGIVFREGSHTPRFRAWDSGQQGSRLREEGVRGLVAQQIQTWSQNVMANILRIATKSDMVPIERPGMSEWMFGSPYNGGQFVRRYAARGNRAGPLLR
jgi:hypothetical protein